MWSIISKIAASVFLCIATIILIGCSTPYKPKGFLGGYSDYQIAEDMFSVSFRGNGYTSDETAQKYLLRRCCEVAKNNGYTCFSLAGSQDNTKTIQFTNSSTNLTGSYSGNTNTYGSIRSNSFDAHSHQSGTFSAFANTNSQTFDITKPAYNVIIKCFREKPEWTGVIDADLFLKSNFAGCYPDNEVSTPSGGNQGTAAVP